jgi:hypothetical protein
MNFSSMLIGILFEPVLPSTTIMPMRHADKKTVLWTLITLRFSHPKELLISQMLQPNT